jgi:hypothetical protein
MGFMDDEMDGTEETVDVGMEAEEAGDLIVRLNKDMRQAAKLMSCREARYLVDLYFSVQKSRVAAENQIKASEKINEPVSLLSLMHGNALVIEADTRTALGMFAKEYAAGKWLQGICGIGPVLSAALLAYLDIRERLTGPCTCKSKEMDEKHGKGMRIFKPHSGTFGDETREFVCVTHIGKKRCGAIKTIRPGALTVDDGILRRPTAGAWWKYAGMDPSSVWQAGKRRPWNATLKTVLWKVEEQFWKQQNRESDVYGKLAVKRKGLEVRRNDRGEHREYALARAAEWKKKKKTSSLAYKSYKEGVLPDGHVHARAKRYTGKIFLSHYYDHCYREYYGKAPWLPYAFERGENPESHSHYIPPPVIEVSGGKSLRELLDR